MKDYKTLYENALERVKDFTERQNPSMLDKEIIHQIFPELRESEDERIRKELISFILDRKNWFPKEETKTSWIAWLEKQKVLTTEEDLQGKKDVLWCIKQAQKYAKDENDMGTCWFAENWLEKQGEQKPAVWSEEDEHCIELLLPIIDSSSLIPKNRKKCKEFLKSLKPQAHWKPSEEQMGTLNEWLKNHQYDGDSRYCYPIFQSLYNDLKTLI